MFQQRNLIGWAAIVCVFAGGYLEFNSADEASKFSGALIKVGLMLAAVWLAFPMLQTGSGRAPLFVFAGLLVLLILAAARPRIFLVGCIIAAIAFAANWILKRINNVK